MPRPPNLDPAGLAELRLACAYHCEIYFFAQLAKNQDVAPPNSEHSADRRHPLAQSLTQDLDALAKILAALQELVAGAAHQLVYSGRVDRDCL
jgi:hypothetical protein